MPASRQGGRSYVLDAGSEGEVSSMTSPRLGDAALVDGENFDLVVAHEDNFTRSSADQSPRREKRTILIHSEDPPHLPRRF